MPFAVEVTHLEAPTEIYDQLGDDTPEGLERTTEVFVVVATYRNTINWFVLGQMNKDAQSFRDEIYTCASLAHNTLERGCGKYYRGTNAVHVKRHHADAFESMYNHNHYPLGGPSGIDFDSTSFPDPVTPAEFKQHMIEFSKADAEMHNGTPRFLTIKKAEKIAAEFEKNYLLEKANSLPQDPQNRIYTAEDIEELRKYSSEEKPCKLSSAMNTRGIGSEKANERQPHEYTNPQYAYVNFSREMGTKLQEKANLLKQQRTLKLAQDFSALNTAVSQACERVSDGSAAQIASTSFQKEAVATAIEMGIQSIAQLSLKTASPGMQVVLQADDAENTPPKGMSKGQ